MQILIMERFQFLVLVAQEKKNLYNKLAVWEGKKVVELFNGVVIKTSFMLEIRMVKVNINIILVTFWNGLKCQVIYT